MLDYNYPYSAPSPDEFTDIIGATPTSRGSSNAVGRSQSDRIETAVRVHLWDWLGSSTRSSIEAGTSHDAGTALMAMASDLRAYRALHPGTLFEFTLPAHRIDSTRNDWLRGLDGVRLIGQGFNKQRSLGTIIKNISTNPWFVNYCSLNTTTMFLSWPIGVLYPSTLHYYEGFKFATITAGSTTPGVTTLTVGDAANFAVGDTVFLYGFDQQRWEGWSPNMRYFEWNIVTATNPATGLISFLYPLRNDYNQDWPDYNNDRGLYDFQVGAKTIPFLGAPRIVNLTRGDNERLLGHFEARNILFDSNTTPHQPNISARVQIYEGCESTSHLGPYEFEYFVARNTGCEVLEIDKLADHALLENFRAYKRIGSCAGTRTVHMRNVVAPPNIQIQVCPAFAIIEDSIVTGEIAMNTLPSATEEIRFTDTKFRSGGFLNGGTDAGTEFLDQEKTITAEGAGPNNEIKATMTGSATAQQSAICGIRKGWYLVRNDGGNGGIVTEITGDGTFFYIAGTWKSAPVNGEVYRFKPIQRIVDAGGNSTEPGKSVWGASTEVGPHETRAHTPRRWRRGPRDLYPSRASSGPLKATWPFLCGYLSDIILNVTEPYTGADSASWLELRNLTSFGGTEYQLAKIDLMTPGLRLIRPRGVDCQLVSAADVLALDVDLQRPVMYLKAYVHNNTGLSTRHTDYLDLIKYPNFVLDVGYVPANGALTAPVALPTSRSAAFTLSNASHNRQIPWSGTWACTVPAAATLLDGFNYTATWVSGTQTISGTAASVTMSSGHAVIYKNVAGDVYASVNGLPTKVST
jgi:hypothetical protein